MRLRCESPERGRVLRGIGACAAAAALALGAAPSQAQESGLSWWEENFEVHGFLTSKSYFRSPGFDLFDEFELNSWRSELNLEFEARLFESDETRFGLFGVVRPTYDAIYETSSLWGADASLADIGTAPAFPNDVLGIGRKSGEGDAFPGHGSRLKGEFTLVNGDTGTFFSGRKVGAVSIDNVVFFGRVTAPVIPLGGNQGKIGGNATGNTYAHLRDNFPLPNAGLPAGLGLDGSLAAASMPLGTPLNFYHKGGLGDRGSLEQGSFDVNRHQSELEFDCLDNAHPWCFARELYAEFEHGNTFLRVGRQQIVWGKTDAFRLQDKINPIDFGYHNVFPDLEERRIPQLAVDVVQRFGQVGPFDDVSLEFAWVVDRFLPDQFGQCGEPWAFTAACEGRADAGGHQLFNFSLARVEEVPWNFQNTEPGLRLEFRLPEPSIAFSLSAFWTRQDQPVARSVNRASVDNPNAASMLFLQGITDGVGTPLAGIIDALAAGGGPAGAYSGGVWLSGFDPYARAADGTPLGSLAAANVDLQNAWNVLTNVLPPAGGGCAGLAGADLANCGGAIAAFGLPWSASEAVLEYPRYLSLGGSLDYQIPGIDTVLRFELAYDNDRQFVNTDLSDWVDESDFLLLSVGLDRSTFIPWLNRNRTAFLSFQTFMEHVLDYDEGSSPNTGPVPYETSVISTLFMQNYWRNDSLVLTSFVAVDWNAGAVITGPYFRWFLNENIYFDVGVNLLWGGKKEHNLADVCADSTLSCLGDPTTWQDGNWQMLNAALKRRAEAPFWGKESFADKFMEDRDEVWFGVTYQF
jgi:hypothetical protein